MDALRDHDIEFTPEEIAYRDSQGQMPLPAEPDPAPDDREPEPVAEGQPEPAPQTEEPADPDLIEDGDESHKGRKVKYGAYLRQKSEAEAARKERDELRQQAEAVRREMAVQQARIQDYVRAQQAAAAQQARPQQAEAPAAPPDPNEDPMGALQWQRDRLAQLEQHVQQSAQERRQAAQIAQLDNVYRSDNYQAAREVPEYADAYNYMVTRADQVIRLQHRDWTEPQVRAEVERQERLLAATAIQQGQRPAALIFQMATAYGWTPKGQGAAQATPAQPDPAAQQAKLDAVAQGQAQNRSLSAAGRPGGNTATMTLDRFLSLSDDEAREWAARNPRDHERLGGGR